MELEFLASVLMTFAGFAWDSIDAAFLLIEGEELFASSKQLVKM
jgi:hypothetical protein